MHSLDRLFDSQRFRPEFRHGPFSRSVPLPDDVKEGDIKATHSDGVLEVPAHLSDQAAQPAAPTITAVLCQGSWPAPVPGIHTARSGSPRMTCCSRGTGPKAPSRP
ncbi:MULTISPECIES: Hsp20/alpha crystallin family protein [Micrococcaceae]|uniref:Hsp20/alpha crystallin family protein n=1 Tax=Micrococcaceae TaxID=1268 RepID=UPI001AE7BEAE|nr:Hsp20/alpha crystallin family protein [Arthrobacter sp. PvP023]